MTTPTLGVWVSPAHPTVITGDPKTGELPMTALVEGSKVRLLYMVSYSKYYRVDGYEARLFLETLKAANERTGRNDGVMLMVGWNPDKQGRYYSNGYRGWTDVPDPKRWDVWEPITEAFLAIDELRQEFGRIVEYAGLDVENYNVADGHKYYENDAGQGLTLAAMRNAFSTGSIPKCIINADVAGASFYVWLHKLREVVLSWTERFYTRWWQDHTTPGDPEFPCTQAHMNKWEEYGAKLVIGGQPAYSRWYAYDRSYFATDQSIKRWVMTDHLQYLLQQFGMAWLYLEKGRLLPEAWPESLAHTDGDRPLGLVDMVKSINMACQLSTAQRSPATYQNEFEEVKAPNGQTVTQQVCDGNRLFHMRKVSR